MVKYWKRGLSTQGVGNFLVAFLKEDGKFEKGVLDEIRFVADSRVLACHFLG